MPPPLAQAAPGAWSWDFALEILPQLLEGLVLLVQVMVVGILIALALGLVLAIARRSRIKLISWPVAAFIEFIRSTPLLVQLFFLFFALPQFGIVLSGFTAGALGLGMHYGTYTSESYRAGIENVDKGQWEAAVAVNLTTSQTWRSVVLPQAIPTVIPALGNYVVAALKDAPLVSAITVIELLGTAQAIQARSFRGLEAYTLAGLLFLVASLVFATLARYLETRYAYQRAA